MSILLEIIQGLEIPVIYYSLIVMVLSGIAIYLFKNIIGFAVVFITLTGLGIAFSLYPDWVLYFSIMIVITTMSLNQKFKVSRWKI